VRIPTLMLAAILLLAAAAREARADLVVTVTANPSGGTNWSFSGGTGTLGSEGMSHFLPAATTSNPQPFVAASDQDNSLTVLSGSNAFAIRDIFVRNYGGLSGSNGSIFDGVDFQTSTLDLDGQSLSALDGLVLYADELDLASLNVGTYTLDSYYDGGANYYTSLGTFTLEVVPEPSVALLLASALAALRLRPRAGSAPR
jgi:hypothetical protein